MKPVILLIKEPLPLAAKEFSGLECYQVPVVWEASAGEKLPKIFPRAEPFEKWLAAKAKGEVLLRSFLPGVSNPVAQTLAGVLGIEDSKVRVEWWIVSNELIPATLKERLQYAWREPAIEEHKVLEVTGLADYYKVNREPKPRKDDSFETGEPKTWGLEFEPAEEKLLREYEEKLGRKWTRAEWEVFAQTWSEHCKHKIFAAEVEASGSANGSVKSLFGTYIRKPALKITEKKPDHYPSLFHDNSGAISLLDVEGHQTDWSVCAKMETHNSPSAISPYGGASTGVVGVHRDILGTGRGALPVANWNVLCFEEPGHNKLRPQTALPPEIIRSGVIRGVEEGGNQSGIPTVQGSVVFDPKYAVKPLVYAGSLGLLPKKFVEKKPAPGQKLYCFGGAVGADGLRGAVMSSRDIRSDDFSGSMVQVANAFVQRRVTDFLMEARDLGLIDVVTDNGAGGLASSVGEMASLTGGATIELSTLRLKFSNLLAWERLLSESQERMTVGTSQPEKLEALAHKWEIPFDRLGELNESGYFEVLFESKALVKIPLELLHEGCPRLQLKTDWNLQKEFSFIETEEDKLSSRTPSLKEDVSTMLSSVHLCSRQKIVRRFDHEVQGRTRRLPFAGEYQASPQDGSILEAYEVRAQESSFLKNKANIVLSHGLAPWRKDIAENVVSSFDEALRQILLAGGKWGSLAALDNFCWPDPLKHEQRLWWLVRANELLALLAEEFQIPFVSGKDSMKNNSKDFAVPPTLVVSIFGSGISSLKCPAGFWSRPNDVIYWIKPDKLSLRDSTWERSLGVKSEAKRDFWFEAQSASQQNEIITQSLRMLKERYASLSAVIEAGLIRSAKDISEGGLVTSLFEMGLGRNLGCDLTIDSESTLELLGEGLGGFVFSVDPHYTREVEAQIPEAKRLGVVIRYDMIRFTDSAVLSLSSLKKSYEEKGNLGFWS